MSFTHGMNAGEVDTLGHLLRQSGERLRGIVGDVDRLVYGVGWGGDSGGDFLQRWPTHKARLLTAAAGISGLGQSALNNVSDQLDASGDRLGGLRPGANGVGGAALPAFLVGIGGSLIVPRLLDLGDRFGDELLGAVPSLLPGLVRDGSTAAWRSGWGFLSNLDVHASFARSVLGPLAGAGAFALGAVNVIGDGIVQAARDSSDATLDGWESTGRLVGAVGVGTVIEVGLYGAAAAVGAIAVTAGAPVVVGLAAGAGVVALTHHVMSTEWGGMTMREHFVEAGADVADAAVDVGRAAFDVASDVGDAAGRAIDNVWPF